METPCPPFYSEPTHELTILFSTSSYARNTNDWYQCIEAAYCNAPSFLGYNPPGEGYLWQKAWKRLTNGYPCNTALETSTTGFLPTEDEESAAENGVNNQFITGNAPTTLIATPRPTSRPTTIEETPSLVSGVVWYDANGDGRQNSLLDTLTQMDHDASMSERGAGISNMRITLRSCSNDALLGVTYTFPRAFGFGSEGNIEIIDSSYIEQIQIQEQDSMGYSDVANDGLGIGNTEGKLGYYSFRVLPSQIPGEFYVVFESPEGYRLTGGSGDYWEVYESAMYDMVQPVMEATWRRNENVAGSSNNNDNRVLQTDDNDEAATLNATMSSNQTTVDTSNGRPQQPKEPINYSGYFARSSCFPIQKSPTQVTNINAGLTEDSWPLVPFQYASFVVTIRFFSAPGTRRKRRRQRELQQPLSLECRKYEKDKADGKNPEDKWGCEQGPSSGGNSLQFNFEKLTLAQGDLVALSVQDFLDSRVSRAWTVKLVSLTHQEMIVLEDDDNNGGGRVRRELLDHLSSPFSNKDDRQQKRYLQGNREIANLVLGFRVRAEYTSDKSTEDLNKVISDSVTSGAESFLSGVKASVPSYFQLAGAITVRDILWTPPVIKEEEEVTDDDDLGNIGMFDDDFLGLREETDLANEGEGGISTMGMVIGVVTSSVIILAGIIMLLMYRHRHKKNTNARKKRFALGANMKAAARRRIIGQDDQSFPSYYDSDESDDLSSRFYSDSSNFDPTTRMQEVASMYSESESESESDMSPYEASEARRKAMQRIKGAKGVRGKFEGLSDGSSYETGSRSYSQSKSAASASYYSQSVGDSYATASKSYNSQSQGGSAIYVDEDISQDMEQSRGASYYSNNVSGASRAYSQSQVGSTETDSRRSQTQSQQGDTSYYSNDISGASRSASHASAPSRQSGTSRSYGAHSRNSGRSMQSGVSSGRHSRASSGASRGSVRSGVSSGRNSRVSRNSKRSAASGRSGRGSTRSSTRSRISQASGSEASRSAAMDIIPEDNAQAETANQQINLFQYSNQFQESQQLDSLDYSLTDEDPYSLTDSMGDTHTYGGTNSLGRSHDGKSRSTRGSGKSRSSRGSKSESRNTVASSMISHESELS